MTAWDAYSPFTWPLRWFGPGSDVLGPPFGPIACFTGRRLPTSAAYSQLPGFPGVFELLLSTPILSATAFAALAIGCGAPVSTHGSSDSDFVASSADVLGMGACKIPPTATPDPDCYACSEWGHCFYCATTKTCQSSATSCWGAETCLLFGGCDQDPTGASCDCMEGLLGACKGSGCCKRLGRCATSTTAECIATSSAGCRAAAICTEYGTCGLRPGDRYCSAVEVADCVASMNCAMFGDCGLTLAGGRPSCAPTSEADCLASVACKVADACTLVAQSVIPRCVRTKPGCELTAGCKKFGLCSQAPNGACKAGKMSDCQNSEECKANGYCYGYKAGSRCYRADELFHAP